VRALPWGFSKARQARVIEIDIINEGWGDEAAWDARAGQACLATLAATPYAKAFGPGTEVSIRLSDDAVVHGLNREWRNKDKPTNVLSFPQLEADELAALATGPISTQPILLGDIILARETCASEAAEKQISFEAHATHLIVHGLLHLLGYDHIGGDEAQMMESIERQVMAQLGLHDPYGED
jgi:probable rRNA maturation factor